MTDLTLVGALAAAVATLAGAVAVLWKDTRDRYSGLEKRTDSHLGVATKQMEVLALMELRMESVEQRLERIGADREAQINDLSRKLEAYHESDQLLHSGQMKVLATIEAMLLPRIDPASMIRKREEPA